MSLTSKDIARICGVSRGTVYRALNDLPGIKPETKAKVLKVAADLHYYPNQIAQSLASRKSFSIGVLVTGLGNRIFSQIISAIELIAEQRGYFVYLTLTRKDPQTELRCIKNMVERKVDGIIMIPLNKGDDFNRLLQSIKVPIVTFGNQISRDWPFVWVDDREAIEDVVHFLAKKNYERIICIAPLARDRHAQNLYSMEQRLSGLQAAATQYPYMSTTVIQDIDYMTALNKTLAIGERRTAILCLGDKYAIRILNQLRQNNIRVPEDVGLMGFDNIDTLEFIIPSLATVGFSIHDIGEYLVDHLIKQIDGKQVPKVTLLEHTIIEGNSV